MGLPPSPRMERSEEDTAPRLRQGAPAGANWALESQTFASTCCAKLQNMPPPPVKYAPAPLQEEVVLVGARALREGSFSPAIHAPEPPSRGTTQGPAPHSQVHRTPSPRTLIEATAIPSPPSPPTSNTTDETATAHPRPAPQPLPPPGEFFLTIRRSILIGCIPHEKDSRCLTRN